MAITVIQSWKERRKTRKKAGSTVDQVCSRLAPRNCDKVSAGCRQTLMALPRMRTGLGGLGGTETEESRISESALCCGLSIMSILEKSLWSLNWEYKFSIYYRLSHTSLFGICVKT